MSGLERVEISIMKSMGSGCGVMEIALLPKMNADGAPPALLDLRGQPELDPGAAPVQVLEGTEYRFSLEVNEDFGPINIEPNELFQPDTTSGRSGRLRPGLQTGTVSVKVYAQEDIVGTFEIEVRSRKLDYLRHYRWMLRDLAESMTEIVMERFAAAEQRFTIDEERDAVTLYQRFALLKSLLDDGGLLGALYHILSRPYSTWKKEGESRLTAQGVRASSKMIRELARPGARQRWDGGHPRLTTIPRRVRAMKSYSSVDNGPNRFVKFELASKLTWEADDVYGAGQRDVATLYEYWTFLQVMKVVASLCGRDFDQRSLFQLEKNGLSVGLQQGKWKAFSGTAKAIGGRRMKMELHFNKTFQKGKGSWTRSMRPDCSLRIMPTDKRADFEDIWVHFDAKYRVDVLSDIMGDKSGEDEAGVWVVEGTAKRDDLLKMHAYRDAIRRSAGAYVLYPGSETQPIQEFHEILPGLGAFPLFPTETGEVGGSHALSNFIKDVLFHVASQVTQHERNRFWSAQTYQADRFAGTLPLPPASFLTRPPVDTLVLLGYVKDEHQLAWIRRSLTYNLRADPERRGRVRFGSRVLAADMAVLYGPPLEKAELYQISGEPSLVRKDELPMGGYFSAGSTTYFVLPIEPINAVGWSELLIGSVVAQFCIKIGQDKPVGAPLSTNWLEMSRFLAGDSKLKNWGQILRDR